MSASRFTIDTNILVYSVDRQAGHRHEIAKHIMGRARFVGCWLTLQAISEFYAVVTRKGMIPKPEARDLACLMLDVYQTAGVSAAAVRSALAASSAGQASYWDALLVATAAEAGCTVILTEDLADGGVLSGIRILHPFSGLALSQAVDALLSG